jgi:uncharacterized protein YlaI
MKKIQICVIVLLFISILFLSGCLEDFRGESDATGFEMIVFLLIIFAVLFVLLLVGLARAGTKKDIVIHSPSQSYQDVKDFKNRKPSMAECEICGKLKDTRELKVNNVDGNELYLCEQCGSRVTKKTEKTTKTEDEILKVLKLRYAKGEITKKEYLEMKKHLLSESDNKDIHKEKNVKGKTCLKCGKKLENKSKFCPFCGTTQEESE